MIRDKMVLGGLVGVLGKIAMDIFEVPLWRMNIVEHPMAHYAASLFVEPNYIHQTIIGQMISIYADFTYGLFLGVIFVYLVYLTGKRQFILKGIMFGAFLWLFSFGALRSLTMVKLREVAPGNTLYYLFFHVVFGLTMGLIMKRLAERNLIE